MRTLRTIIVFLIPLVVLQFFVAGCGEREDYTLSPRVIKLCERYPSPFDSVSAVEAAREAQQLLQEYPRDFQLARYYMDRMEPIDPVALANEFHTMHSRYPDDGRWAVLEAMVSASRGEYFEHTDEALKQHPNDPYLMIEHARAVLGRRPVMLEDATDLAFRAIEVAPNLPDANGLLAYILLWVEKPEEALGFATHAMELNPYEFSYVETRALILNKMGQREEGIVLMEQYLDAHPNNPAVRSTLLDRYLADRAWEKMIPLKRQAAMEDASNGIAYVELGLVFQRLGWIDSTFSSLNEAVNNGFIDKPFLEFAFDQDLAKLKSDKRYTRLLTRMDSTRVASRDRRREEALADPLDLPAPKLDGEALEGYPVTLEDHRGRTVVLGFWSTWSGWAKITEPRLKKMYRSLPSTVDFIGVNVLERVAPEQRTELIERYVEDQQLPWSIWLSDDITATRFGVQALPSYLVIDRDGIIRYHLVGYAPYVDEVLGWMVEAVEKIPDSTVKEAN